MISKKFIHRLGYRITDRVQPLIVDYNLHVLAYDRNMYQNVNEFIGRFTFFFNRYVNYIDDKGKKVRIKEFLKDNNLYRDHVDDKIIITSFIEKNESILYELNDKQRETNISGIFTADNYRITCTHSHMFFIDNFTNEKFIYSGDLI